MDRQPSARVGQCRGAMWCREFDDLALYHGARKFNRQYDQHGQYSFWPVDRSFIYHEPDMFRGRSDWYLYRQRRIRHQPDINGKILLPNGCCTFMTDLAIIYREKALSSDSAIKWTLLVVLALVNLAWIVSAGFRIAPDYLLTFGAAIFLACISRFYSYTGREQRIMEFAHFGAQLLALYALLMMLSYLAVSTNTPLVDDTFDVMDKSLGMDWVTWVEWVRSHPRVQLVLVIAYASLPIQGMFCYIYNIHTREFWRNSEIWWITLIAAIITIAGSAAFPATNPYVYYGLENPDYFVHMQHFLGLRDGTMRLINFMDAQGLIQLPSFHTVLAIMLTYNLRRNRWFFLIAVVINATLILACPTEGCHYFVDLFAGAAVAAATIWTVRRMRLN